MSILHVSDFQYPWNTKSMAPAHPITSWNTKEHQFNFFEALPVSSSHWHLHCQNNLHCTFSFNLRRQLIFPLIVTIDQPSPGTHYQVSNNTSTRSKRSRRIPDLTLSHLVALMSWNKSLWSNSTESTACPAVSWREGGSICSSISQYHLWDSASVLKYRWIFTKQETLSILSV